jgi:VanZ family protein
MKILKVLAVVYIFFLAFIIVLYDIKETQYLFKAVRKYAFADKAGHLLLMGLMAMSVSLHLGAHQINFWRLRFFTGSLIVFVIVTLEETSQLLIPNRTFDPMDLLANYFGIFLCGEFALRLLLLKLDYKN